MGTLSEKLRVLLKEISNVFKESSRLLAGSWFPLHAVNVFESMVLYHKKPVPRGGSFPVFISAIYDVIPLLFLEGAIVRGVRYSGRRTLDRYTYSVKRLELGSERFPLFPTYITRGFIRDAGSVDSNGISGAGLVLFLRHQLKPLVLLKEVEGYGKITCVLSSPFTGLEIRINNRGCIMAPFSALVRVSFMRARERQGPIFCYPRPMKYIMAAARLFVYRVASDVVVKETRPLPVIIPEFVFETNEQLKDAYEARGEAIVGALLSIDSEVGYVANYSADRVMGRLPGRLVLLSTVPYVLEYSLLVSADIEKYATMGQLKGAGFLYDKRRVPLMISLPRGVVDEVRRRLTVTAEDLGAYMPVIWTKGLVELNRNFLSSPPPPLVALSILHGLDVKELEGGRKGIMLPDGSTRTIFRYANAIFAWEKAATGYRELVEQYGLYVPV